jgi:hypothetical protein
MTKFPHGYDHATGEGQKRLMYESVGLHPYFFAVPVRRPDEDYGSDPMGDGTFRMVPSGDIVSLEERQKRLGHS